VIAKSPGAKADFTDEKSSLRQQHPVAHFWDEFRPELSYPIPLLMTAVR
jgi:hypothetical protein